MLTQLLNYGYSSLSYFKGLKVGKRVTLPTHNLKLLSLDISSESPWTLYFQEKLSTDTTN